MNTYNAHRELDVYTDKKTHRLMEMRVSRIQKPSDTYCWAIDEYDFYTRTIGDHPFTDKYRKQEMPIRYLQEL